MTALAAGAEFGSSNVPDKWVAIDAATPVLAANARPFYQWAG